MAKGSNNIRGRSSDASKPYDVSNSFVKRVATRVTELLPQPSSWFSRWMSPSEVPNASDFVGHSLSSTITSRPPATSRAELNLVDNVDHHAPAAKKARTNRYNSPVNQKYLRNDQYSAEDISPIAVRGGEPIAGPSSRDTRPELIASTPAMPGQQIVAKVNGDDCSETSESTSGCSSLVPQAQSSTRSLGGSRFGRSIPGGTSLDALDRRRPSFNTTTFNSPLRASMRARLGSSPFYSGRTMYGGSSQACDYARLVETTQSRQASLVRRVGTTVRPPPSQEASLPLSSTAKRILDALEQFSTPMIDAKKMPVVGTKRKFDSTLTGTQQRYTELSIPSTPDLLRVKRRERLQQSTLDARQTAAQSVPTHPVTFTSPAAPVAAEYTIRKEETERKKHTGKVKTKEKLEEETVVEVKLPAAVLAVDNLPKIDIAIPPAPPALKQTPTPAAVTTASTKFVFSQPTIVTSVVATVSVPTSTFKFSEPLGTTTSSSSVSVTGSSDSLIPRTPTVEISDGFSKPIREDKKKNAFIVNFHAVSETSKKTASTGSSAVKFNDLTPDSKYVKGNVDADNKTVSSTQKWECTKCKNNNSSNIETCISCQTNKNSRPLDASKNNIKSTVGGLEHLCKKPVGTWECQTCLIRNKSEAMKCIACETLKPSPKEKTTGEKSSNVEKPGILSIGTSETKQSESGFGNLFKKPPGSWTCDTCMVSNDAGKEKCVACETQKPGATGSKSTESSGAPSVNIPSGSGFGNLFKKPSGSWSCNICMINNDADKMKCAACETPKPGAELPKATEPAGPKFSFGIPSAVSSSGIGAGATFSFGIPKGEEANSTTNTSLALPKSTSSSDNTQPTPSFSFGIPKLTENLNTNAVSSSTGSKSTFQFGSGSAQANAESTSLPITNTPTTSNSFGDFTKKSISEISKPADSGKPAFSLTPSTVTPSPTIKSVTPLFAAKTEKLSPALEKTATAPTQFAFGADKVSQDEKKSSDASSTSKPTQSTFMFGAKQEGFGSNLPSSTTNTLSSSSPSNVFKFGDTKTVSSGSGATSISSVSTQASVMTPKPNNMFSFGSNIEKKTITFGATPVKESVTSSTTGTSGTENKSTFGSFGASANTTSSTFGSSAFGSATGFGSSTPGNKEQLNPFVTQTTTTNVFGATTTNTSTSTFSTFGQTNAFPPPQQENKPSPVFTFGASAPPKEPAPSGGFVFNPVMFQPNQTQQNAPNQLFGFNNSSTTAAAPSANFNFEPKAFGSAAQTISPFNASASAPTPVFGAPTQQTPAFGEQANPAPVLNFGAQPAQQSQTSANPVFEFGSNQQQSVAVAPSAALTFSFGATPAAPAMAAPQANPPAFDPNIKPTFNFTQGAGTPVFSAIPTANSAAGAAQPQNRKFRKAVRRTNTSSVRN